MFKSLAIEYGSYILFGLLISVITRYYGINPLAAWIFIIAGMLYSSVIIPTVRRLAWGKEE